MAKLVDATPSERSRALRALRAEGIEIRRLGPGVFLRILGDVVVQVGSAEELSGRACRGGVWDEVRVLQVRDPEERAELVEALRCFFQPSRDDEPPREPTAAQRALIRRWLPNRLAPSVRRAMRYR